MTSLDIQQFFPEQLKITEIFETKEKIIIELESQTKQGTCPCCGVVSTIRIDSTIAKNRDS